MSFMLDGGKVTRSNVALGFVVVCFFLALASFIVGAVGAYNKTSITIVSWFLVVAAGGFFIVSLIAGYYMNKICA